MSKDWSDWSKDLLTVPVNETVAYAVDMATAQTMDGEGEDIYHARFRVCRIGLRDGKWEGTARVFDKEDESGVFGEWKDSYLLAEANTFAMKAAAYERATGDVPSGGWKAIEGWAGRVMAWEG